MIKLSSEPLVPPLLIFPCTYTLDPIPYSLPPTPYSLISPPLPVRYTPIRPP
jgi:hypothetical protein